MKRAVAMVGVGLAVLAAAGCSGESDGEAIPIPERTSSISSNHSRLPHSGAPAVTDPLPESVVPDDPCEVLTPDQIENLLGDEASVGKRTDLAELGPGCDWSNQETLGGFLVSFDVVSRDGLSAQYANTKPQVQVFRELPSVGGFPAVAYKDSESSYRCTVAVGLADEYSVITTVSLSIEKQAEGVDPCAPSEQVSEIVVENLKAKLGGR